MELMFILLLAGVAIGLGGLGGGSGDSDGGTTGAEGPLPT